jgi:hypothetical protein
MSARQVPHAPPHFPARYSCLAAWLILFLAGCSGPTHTAGTSGRDAKELSVLSVVQLPEESPIQIRTIQFDGTGDEYEIGKSRDFYLLPRDHTASFTLTASVPKDIGGMGGAAGWFMPKKVNLPVIKDVPLGALSAGKTYELAHPAEGFDKMLQSGGLSLVREKGT